MDCWSPISQANSGKLPRKAVGRLIEPKEIIFRNIRAKRDIY